MNIKKSKKQVYKKEFSIQSIIMVVLTTLTLITVVIISGLFYHRFKQTMDKTAVSNTSTTVENTVERINSKFLDIRHIFNAASYNVIQEYDISSQEFDKQFSLLYEINSDKLQSIALYRKDGTLIASEPVAVEKENTDVKNQDWYSHAKEDIENVHFSMPHTQNLFQDGTFRYYRVISVSQSVEINDGGKSESGVLLIDMKCAVVEDVLKQINESADGIYYYMCNRDGEIVYHPRKSEISRGLFTENSSQAAGYEDGVYTIASDSGQVQVVVGSIAYTGWKVIGVIPKNRETTIGYDLKYYILVTMIVLLMMLLACNRVIARKISNPIRILDESVKAYEAGGRQDIYIGGSSEIRHLGRSVKKSYAEIEKLMDEIIRQQNERRKSELAALQSQINPHFLYNTLESITWMVEAHKNDEAVFMISQLAKLLRISLSKGKTIISIADELQHSRSYMDIQLARYKERFKTEFLIDEGIENYCIVKLVIQPILENAIYYGVGDMEADEGGKITVRGEKIEDDIYISIEDNGMGMREDVLENILTNNDKVPKHGSGVGVINVHSRIRLLFGEKYGLQVYSEPDEGTKVVIHIPAIPYTKENVEQLETQSLRLGERKNEKE